jgi:hypothetical protein
VSLPLTSRAEGVEHRAGESLNDLSERAETVLYTAEAGGRSWVMLG